jgi:hypothetical protein
MSKSSHAPQFNFDRFMGWVAYVIWFYSVFCLLLVDLSLLYFAFLRPKSLAFWQEIIHFLLRIPSPDFSVPEPQVGLLITVLLLMEAGLLWFTYKYGRQAITDFLAWKKFSYTYQLTLYYRAQRQLAFFYALARLENERSQFVQRQQCGKIQEDNLPGENILFEGNIQRVGPFSRFYLFLFNYLLPPSAIKERQAFFTYLRQFPNMVQITSSEDAGIAPFPSVLVVSEDAEHGETANVVQIDLVEEQEPSLPSSAISSSESDNTQVEALPLKNEMQRSGSIYVFTALPTIFLGKDERISFRIKDATRLSLLMFLAIYAREHTIRTDDIIDAIYESGELGKTGKNVEQLRERFYKDVYNLRQLFKKTAEQAHLIYSDPIKVDGKGKQAVWHLSGNYEVVDVTALEHFFQQGLKEIQAGPNLQVEEFRKVYTKIIEYYQKGFLSELLRKEEVGNWARALQITYQNMYRQIIWKVAAYEQKVGLNSSPGEQNVCFQQAAWLYEKYAHETISDKLPGNQKLSVSEAALQKAMDLYARIDREHDALRAYQEYAKAMIRRRKDRQPHFQTEQVRQKIAQEL